MTREEAFWELDSRMHLPENKDRYYDVVMNPSKENSGELLYMHMRHAREYLNILGNEKDELIENSFSATINEIKRILDTQGWEK